MNDFTRPGRHMRFLTQSGRNRRCHVQVPAGCDPRVAVPVVVVLHGAGSSGANCLDRHHWGEWAEKANFLAVAPEGWPSAPDAMMDFANNPRVWNAGQFPPGHPRTRIDDVAFLRRLLDDLSEMFTLDLDRVYLVGHSNGGGMALRTAAEASHLWAAVAVVASPWWLESPVVARPMPTLYVSGMNDPLVPLNGGLVQTPWGPPQQRAPVQVTLDSWADALGCPRSYHAEEADGVRTLRYEPGRNGATLTAQLIEGQGHGWPGGLTEPGMPAEFLGPRTDRYHATSRIWDFFQQHRRR